MIKEKIIKVIIVGTNDFDDYHFFEEKLYEELKEYFEEDYKIVIREQEANTTDGFAVKFSKENGCELERYKIQWDELGKRAGFENFKKLLWGEEANAGADLLLAFQSKWDGVKDRYMLNKLIQEFKSIIDFENFNSKKYFLFVR